MSRPIKHGTVRWAIAHVLMATEGDNASAQRSTFSRSSARRRRLAASAAGDIPNHARETESSCCILNLESLPFFIRAYEVL